jgi:membrane protein implicated in regulation of membrane protease activity
VTDSRPSSATAPTDTKPIWIVVGLLLAVGIVVPLLVWLYDTETPALGGFPFFFWFQFLLIPIVSGLTYVAFRLSQTATARDREARRAAGRRS